MVYFGDMDLDALNLETSNNPGVGNAFGVCECCRRERYLTRHHIVPYAFSKHFDSKTFPDNSMMLCRPCHDIVEIELRKFRKFFRGRLGITPDDLRQSDEHIRYKKAKAYAWQLVSNHGNIPVQKIMEMTLYVVSLYPDAHGYDDFRRIARDESRINSTRTHPYGKIVAERIKELGMEDWFWKVWKAKNKRIVGKLQKKGVDAERVRKKNAKHAAPETDVSGVVLMLVSVEGMDNDIAREFYKNQDKETQLSLRRCAYAWNKKQLKKHGIVDEATKEETCEFISRNSGVSIETAGEIYKMYSKRRKRKARKEAFEYLAKSTRNV